MLKLAPNLYHLFKELPIQKRFAAAASLGFDAVEWHFPYELPKETLKSLLDDSNLRLVHALTPVDTSKTWGIAGHPDKVDEFKRATELALEYAQTAGIATFHPHPGPLLPEFAREQCLDVLASNLDWFCAQTEPLGVTVLVESVCRLRAPQTMLRTLEEAAKVVRRIGRPNLKLIYDAYHVRNEEPGSLCTIFDQYQPLIGHVQIANVPGRHEPGVGDIDFRYFLAHLDERGYDGWVGLEYDPSVDTVSSLRWIDEYGVRKR